MSILQTQSQRTYFQFWSCIKQPQLKERTTMLKSISVVLTTKIDFNIKEAKDLMDHGSNPIVVVKSKVIILWVIIHWWAGVLRPLLLGQHWGTQSDTRVKGVALASYVEIYFIVPLCVMARDPIWVDLLTLILGLAHINLEIWLVKLCGPMYVLGKQINHWFSNWNGPPNSQ